MRGTGWVDHTLIETTELLTRGDIATCCIQYGRYPSFLSVQKVALGRGQFRLLLWGVKQRLQEHAPERRPRVLVFGESLGAWSSSVLLGWLYLSARLVLYAAELNVVLARRLWPRSLLQPPLTEQDKQVLIALAETQERRPEQNVEVTFSSEAGTHDDSPPAPGG